MGGLAWKRWKAAFLGLLLLVAGGNAVVSGSLRLQRNRAPMVGPGARIYGVLIAFVGVAVLIISLLGRGEDAEG